MITKEYINELFARHCEDEDVFLVDVIVKNNQVIDVLLDTPQGITAAQCAAISRRFRHELDEQYDVYELNVSSPGVGAPLRIKPQFVKNIGREVELILNGSDSKPFKALLLDAHDDYVVLQREQVVKEGKKKRKQVEELRYSYPEIQTIKVVVSFK